MADAPIGVLGTGAVGCMMAALLHEAGHDVVLVARGSASSRRRGERLRSAGLRFERRGAAPAHLAPAVLARMLDGDRLGACDAIIATVKRTGNGWVGATLRDRAAPDCVVACAQNGTNQRDEILRAAAPWAGTVLDGMLSVAVNLRDDGAVPRCVTYSGNEALRLDGAFPRAAAVAASIDAAGFPCSAVADVGAIQRTKMILNQNNAVSALLGCSVAEAISDPTARRVIGTCMLEARAVFEAQGYALDAALLGPIRLLTLPEALFRCLLPFLRHRLPADEFASSMNQDLAAVDGRATEVAYLNGEIVAAGKEAGVPTPCTAKVLAAVEAIEAGTRPRRALTAAEARAEFLP